MSNTYIICGIAVMAITTYLIRSAPMVLFRKRIENVWIRSFLHYVPYAVLGAMTFPAVFSSTGTTASAVAGSVVAILLAYFKRSLLTVALGAAATVFVVQMIGF